MKYLQNVSLLILATSNTAGAFAPIVSPAQQRNLMGASEKSSSTALGFGFLKDLGLEKPSWLPDFGGGEKKEEEAPKAEASDEEAEADGGEDSEAAAETEEAPAP